MNSNKKKNPIIGIAVVIVLLTLSSVRGEGGLIAALIIAVYASVFAIAKVLKNKTGRGESPAPKMQERPAPKTETALHFDKTKARSTGKYEMYDHDTAHRLEQLDGFLKNGTIDKKEYRLLKERYLRGE